MLPPGGEPPGSGQPPRELAAALRSAAAASRAAGVRARFFYLDTARTDAAGFLSAYWGAGPGGPGTAPAAPPPWFPPLPAVVAYGADAEGAPPGGAPSRKYRLPAPAAAGPHTAESLAAFAAAAASGALPAWRLSAPPPPPHPRPPPPGAVAAVVGDSFGELVLDPARDVLLAVTAAWCAHCAAAAPVLAALARRFAPVPSVRVATFDAAANEHEALAGLLAGYPGFLLWPAGDPKPAPAAYDQAAPRTLAALTRFVKRHATVPYELPRRGAAAAAAAAGAQAERTEDERAPAALRDGGTTAAVAEAGHDEL